jgi:hypothetical protein
MGLFKVWLHLENEDIDISQIITATSLREAIEKAKSLSQTLNARLKAVDNIHSGSILEDKRSKGVMHDGHKHS